MGFGRKAQARWAVLIGAVGTAASVLVVGLAWSLPIPPPSGPAHMRIESVLVAPEAPGPGDVVTVTARVVGVRSPTVALGYAVQFGAQVAETRRMDRSGEGEFARTIGPFADGAEVWLLVAASVGDFGPIVSEPMTVHVGTPWPVGLSTLSIDFASVPPPSTFFFETVEVFLRLTNTTPIQSAVLSYVMMGLGGGDGTMFEMNQVRVSPGGSEYAAFIEPSNVTVEDRVVVAYRVAVQDAAGSRVVSRVETYIAEFPRPVP